MFLNTNLLLIWEILIVCTLLFICLKKVLLVVCWILDSFGLHILQSKDHVHVFQTISLYRKTEVMDIISTTLKSIIKIEVL